MNLPEFTCTEEAVRFGRTMTRDEFVLLTGARAALQRRFAKEPNEQQRLFIAVEIQLYREALDAAPDVVLASTILDSRLAAVAGITNHGFAR